MLSLFLRYALCALRLYFSDIRKQDMVFEYEYTDTFAGEANYCWVRRGTVSVPELTHYGYDGSNGYSKANAMQARELIKRVKRALGIAARHKKEDYGDTIRLNFPGTVCFIQYSDTLN
jgi:hypothetical protein